MNKPIKVLYFVDRLLIGGIQSLVINWISRFDKEKIKVDFLILDDGNKYELEETLKKLGCNVYKLDGIWCRKPTDFIKYARRLDEFFKEHNDYKVVHMHSSSKNYMVLKYAKKYGVPIRIAHSHSIDFQTKNLIKKLVGKVMKKSLIKYSTDFFACSRIAGEWLFGNKIVAGPKFKLINNAIDYENFKFDEDTRKKIRLDLNVANDEILIGHAGRFTKQKNHTFLIEIFAEILKLNDKAKLIMLGTGETEVEIKEKVKIMGIEKNVIFAGFRTNINEYMQAMDLFLLPSLCEGLGLVLIEAQASGMPCFTSKDVVPKEVSVSGNLEYISLNSSAMKWAEIINKKNYKRKDCREEIKKKGYFIEDVVNELENFYLN